MLICVQNPDFINITVTHTTKILYNLEQQRNYLDRLIQQNQILIFERNKPMRKAQFQFDRHNSAENTLYLNNTIIHGLSILVYECNHKEFEFQVHKQSAKQIILFNKNKVQSILVEMPRNDQHSKWLLNSPKLNESQTVIPPLPNQICRNFEFQQG
ncbi:unnamed protein product [Paramecium sonneborni]|uniref:Uncharacterized protein n=1 Tax=Paramecium sonneborni TaxID=65129 RepID=A0A8S1MVI0_9CILI|nr:unnamed protein product [Paramecium sonneborni]